VSCTVAIGTTAASARANTTDTERRESAVRRRPTSRIASKRPSSWERRAIITAAAPMRADTRPLRATSSRLSA
jgi:hypothetical protein